MPRRLRPHARPRCSPTPARSARASPPSTRPTSTDDDVALLGGAGATLLPLPDDRARPRRRHRPGAARCARPARRSRSARDSHAVIDLFEEARAVELDERLATGERGHHARGRAAARGDRRRPRLPRLARRRAGSSPARSPTSSRSASTASGSPGTDRATALESRRLRRRAPPTSATWSSAGGAIVARRAPRRASTSPRELRRRDRGGDRHDASSIDNIGLLVTNDPELGEGPLGIVRDAALVIEGDRVAAIERGRARPPTSASTPAGRCVIPGFVDSHTHLVFAGDRARRVRRADGRARRTRRAGIRVTTEATRAAARRASSRALAARAAAPRRCAPASPTSRSSPATGSTSRPSARCCEVAARAHRRRHVPRRPRRPGRVRGPRRRLRRARLRRDARRPARRTPAGSTSSARRARSTPTSRAPCSRPAATPGSACACTATSSGPGPGVQLAVELGAASVDHCTYLDRRRHRGARRRATPSPPSCRPPTSRPASPTPTRAA